MSPEFFRSKSPSAVSKIPTYPHKLFPLKIPTFCQIIPTFFINPHNFKKKSQHFWKFGYKFFEYFRKVEVFFKISIAYLKFRSPLEKNDPHWAPENPHIGDISPILETLKMLQNVRHVSKSADVYARNWWVIELCQSHFILNSPIYVLFFSFYSVPQNVYNDSKSHELFWCCYRKRDKAIQNR